MAYRTLNDINKSVASDVESFIESAEEGFDSSVSSLVGNFIHREKPQRQEKL